MIPLKKGLFHLIWLEISQYVSAAGAHTGAPLQVIQNTLNKGVGEGPCALPLK